MLHHLIHACLCSMNYLVQAIYLCDLYSVGVLLLLPLCVCILHSKRQINLMHTLRGSLSILWRSPFIFNAIPRMFCHRPPKRGRLKEYLRLFCFDGRWRNSYGLMCANSSQVYFIYLHIARLSRHQRHLLAVKGFCVLINWRHFGLGGSTAGTAVLPPSAFSQAVVPPDRKSPPPSL